MSTIFLVRGICASCRFGPECPNHHGAAVMQCEQFAACDPAPSARFRPAPPWHEVSAVGLCTRCHVEATCHLPRPESGVWLCEGFQ